MLITKVLMLIFIIHVITLILKIFEVAISSYVHFQTEKLASYLATR